MSQMLAKRGPSPEGFQSAKNEENQSTIVNLLHRRWAALGGYGNTMTKTTRTHTADLNFEKTLMATLSNTSQHEQQNLHWRVSIGASARRVNTSYVPNSNVPGHSHSWGKFGSRANAAESIGGCYQGTRVVAAGAPGAHYNSKEIQNQAFVLMDQINFERGAEVNTTHIWYKVWYNVAQITLGELMNDNFNRPHWANRPANPTFYRHMINGLNHYNNEMALILTGQSVTIELDTPDIGLIPYLTYLLGGAQDTFAWRWGNHGGNNREPHLTAKTPVGFTYGFMIRDNFNVAPAVPVNPPLPGLPAGAAVPANSVVANWNRDELDRAIGLIARSIPVASDCEAACIKVAIDVFAEPHRGVGIDEICGSNQRNAGYNAFLDETTTRIPSGSTACSFGTRITDRSANTRAAEARAQSCLDLMRSMQGVRCIAEACVLPLQLAGRQLGVSIQISYAGLNAANVLNANVPAPNATVASNGALLTEVGRAGLDEPSQLLLMTSMVMEVMYRAVMPESGLYFDYGNTLATASCPRLGEANIGECLTSVHAGQVLNGMLTTMAIGLAGIPNKLDAIAAEAQVKFASVGKPVVDGISNSTIDDGNADALPGMHMLGHAYLFTRDDNLQPGDTFEVEVAGFKDKQDNSTTVRATGVQLTVNELQAYSTDGTFNDPTVHTRVMTLFADFDRQRFVDLRLALPSSNTVSTYALYGRARSRVPGFVAAMIASAFDAMTGNIGIKLVQHSRKRKRITGPAAVKRGQLKRGDDSDGGDDDDDDVGGDDGNDEDGDDGETA
jgi:hypothetical protein